MSYDKITSAVFPEGLVSQSLWNRAMSYDLLKALRLMIICCLNPFGTGQCLTTGNGSKG